jgi:hypothetical protein
VLFRGERSFIKPWTLAILLILFAAYSLIARAHLFDNLVESAYFGLFEILHQAKSTLLFGLGVYCLGWYYITLARIKDECLSLRGRGENAT